MASFGIFGLIFLLLLPISVYYLRAEEKKKPGTGYLKGIFIGVFLIILNFIVDAGYALLIFGLLYLLIGLMGRLTLKPEKEPINLQIKDELLEIGSKMDKMEGDVKVIKKEIGE
ncbi:MAG: hypothetical protein GTO02_08930 [Candidatus Dadabacteria bacterium]|nr:hypothetical protein [Candidatus Dadabacteria bacterium]